MAFEYTGSFGIPGIYADVETEENIFWWDREENQIWTNVLIEGAARDSGNTGSTDVLRPGLLLGRLTATNKVTEWDPAATDGSERLFGILGPAMKMQRLGSNLDRWVGRIMVGGCVKTERLLIPGGATFGISGDTNEHMVLAQLFPRFQPDGNHWGNPGGGWQAVRTPTTVEIAVPGLTVTEAQNNTLFTTRGNTADNFVFTLPATPKKGLRYGFYNVADQGMLITAGANELVGANNATGTTLNVSTASEHIGVFVEVIGDGTSWLSILHLPQEAFTTTVS